MALSADSGDVVSQYSYDPYGNVQMAIKGIPNPFGYAGRFGVATDGASLYHMRAREYSSSLGQFLTDDPIKMSGGDTNVRRYVRNNPLGRGDSSGLGYWMKRRWFPGITGIVAGNNPVSDLFNVELGHEQYFFDDGTNIGFHPSEGGNPLLPDPGTRFSDPPSKLSQYRRTGEYYNDSIMRQALDQVKDKPYWVNPFGRNSQNCQEWAETVKVVYWQLNRKHVTATRSENITPSDPNEKVGPAGLGAERLVAVSDELHYTVYFENIATASAPAQEVFVTDYLDADLDWTTFRPDEVAWGDQVVTPPAGVYNFTLRQTVEDYRADVKKSWWVDASADLDPATGRVRWTFRTLDPDTGELPEDPLAGFLPPNDATRRGEGHVSFSVRPCAGSPNGTALTNSASIVFDVNEPIETNTVSNTIGTPPRGPEPSYLWCSSVSGKAWRSARPRQRHHHARAAHVSRAKLSGLLER